MDPRIAVIEHRLAGIRRVVGVTGSKGGIGKSVVSTSLALSLADRGMDVGLFDLDFTSPSDHVILGLELSFPDEAFGIDPHIAHGISLMSVASFTGDAATPLRGADTTHALLELLAITRWQELDVLVLDLPPGLGDAALDVIRFIPRVEFLLLGTGSSVVIESVRRAIALLTELDAQMLGVIENMRRAESDAVADLALGFGVPFVGSVPFDPALESALGDVDRLRTTAAFLGVDRLGRAIIE